MMSYRRKDARSGAYDKGKSSRKNCINEVEKEEKRREKGNDNLGESWQSRVISKKQDNMGGKKEECNRTELL